MVGTAAAKRLCNGDFRRHTLQCPGQWISCKKGRICGNRNGFRGRKNVLGIWLGANESAKYWLSVLNGLKNRGVSDILIASVVGLTGFVEIINTAFPKTEVQRCSIHQIRSSSRLCVLQRYQAIYG